MNLSWALEALRETMKAEESRCMDDRDDREAFARTFEDRLRAAVAKASMAERRKSLAEMCSFCEKPRKDIALLIAPYAVGDPPPVICNECIVTCVELMSTHLHKTGKRRT